MIEHNRNKQIEFDSDKHQYLYEGKEKFYGVTSWIGQFTKPFDPSIAKYIAYRDGRTEEDVLQDWEDARLYGNEVDTQVKQYVAENLDLQTDEIRNFKEAMKTHELTPVATGWVIYNEEFKRASEIDLVCKNKKDELVIVDVKSMEKPIDYSSYRNRKMKGPFKSLPDSRFFKQSLQVGLYRDWVKNIYKLPVSKNGYILRLRYNLWELITTFNVETEINKLYEYERKNKISS